MKIICIGWNFKDHNRELNAEEYPTHPTVFLKPDSALLKDGKPFFIPDFSNQIEHEIELVVKINRIGKNIAQRFAHRYYDEITLGVDFTARDLQTTFRQKGAPWELSKGFDGSAAIGDFILKEEVTSLDKAELRLDVNNTIKQQGKISDMIFSVDEIIAYVSKFYTLKIGDLLFCGTPPGVDKVAINDHLEGYLDERKIIDFWVK